MLKSTPGTRARQSNYNFLIFSSMKVYVYVIPHGIIRIKWVRFKHSEYIARSRFSTIICSLQLTLAVLIWPSVNNPSYNPVSLWMGPVFLHQPLCMGRAWSWGGRAQVLASCWHRGQHTETLSQPYPVVCLCRAHKQMMVSTFLNGWRQKEYYTRHMKCMPHSNFDVGKSSFIGTPSLLTCCHGGCCGCTVTEPGVCGRRWKACSA